MKSNISVTELLDIIPDSVYDNLGKQSKVDYQVKKLTGQRIFKLLLYGLLSGKELSFRILETYFESAIYQSLVASETPLRTDHSSLSDRLATIEVSYFKSLFEYVSSVFSDQYSLSEIGNYRLVRFDSTMIGITSKLLKMNGLQTGDNPKKIKDESERTKNIKFSVGFDGTTVRQIELYNEQTFLSENVALRDVIEKTSLSKKDIAVFDKGITRRDTYSQFSNTDIIFVTRIHTPHEDSKRKLKYKKVRDVTLIDEEKPLTTQTIRIDEDIEVHLYNEKHAKTKQTFRLVKTTRLESGEKINFLTNHFDLSAAEITEIYRLRWEIEVFFKFLKQEFNFKHFLSRNENGLKVMMYMTVIAAMLVNIYRKINRIEGFKIAKLKFINELEREVIKIMIETCQGKPELLAILYPLRN